MPLSGVQKSKHPCSVCAKRKVKCDRLIPCTNCVKRGFEKDCLEKPAGGQSDAIDDFLPRILRFWQKYEYWVGDIALSKSANFDTTEKQIDLQEELKECEYWCNFLSREQSFALLDYSIERLGVLYFGCVSDISELYLILEMYWYRREHKNEKDVVLTVDAHYSDALVWSIFCLAVHYMPSKTLHTIFPILPQHELFKPLDHGYDFEDRFQRNLSRCFERCTTTLLLMTNFTANSDIRLIQIYLILSSTMYPHRRNNSSDSLLLQSFHTAKIKHVNDFKPLISDSAALRLTKVTCEKMWYRLCTCDYLQSSPNKPITFHTELSSLLQHAAYLEDLPTTDVYQSEDSFEVFYWKVLSLDRDLDQYLTKELKPPLKTLDAVQRQVEIFSRKLSSPEESTSLDSEFARFLISYLVDGVSWKLHKMFFIYYGISASLGKSIHFAKSLIALVIKNMKLQKDLFNRHPIVIWSLARVALFYRFLEMFDSSAEVQDINLDVSDILHYLPKGFTPHLNELIYLLERLQMLKDMWEYTGDAELRKTFSHPVFRILQSDIDTVSQQYTERPSMISGSGPLRTQKVSSNLEKDTGNTSDSYSSLIESFQEQCQFDIQVLASLENFV